MANRSITDLPIASSIADDDTIHINQSTVDKRGTFLFLKQQILLDTQTLVDQATAAKDAAVIAQTGAEDALIAFSDIYYGALASDPATKPSGAATTEGDLYFNTTIPSMKVYRSGIWDSIDVTTALEVLYDNVTSGLAATTVQGAIDELSARGNVSVRNTVLNQDPVTQSESTRAGFEALLGTNTTGIGGTNYLRWTKDRNNIQSHSLSDSVRGDFYLSSDSTAAEVATVPAITTDDITWTWRLDLAETGVTNRNKAYTLHSNPRLGISVCGYIGDGIDGHEIPHGLIQIPELEIYKNRSNATGWVVKSSFLDKDDFLFLNTTDATTTAASTRSIITEITSSLGTSTAVNNSGDSYISYHFHSVPSVSKIGKYIGTAAAGNYVDCGFGNNVAGWIMIKNLTTGTTNWVNTDSIRGGNAALYPNSSAIEASAESVYPAIGGFYVSGTDADTNTLNDEYLYIAFAQSAIDATKATTDYSYPLTADIIAVVNNTVVSVANGFNASGQLDDQYEFTGGVTRTYGVGHEDKTYYLYTDQLGNLGDSEYRPLEGTSRNQADKWGVVSPVDASLRTTDKHFDYESPTGVVNASVEDSGGEIFNAFNKNENDIISATTSWISTGNTTANIVYRLDEARIPKSVRLREYTNTTYTPYAFTISGSNDGFTKTTLHTETTYAGNGASLWGNVIDLSAVTTAYKYLHIDVTSVNGGANIALAEIEFNTILPSDYYLVNEGVMYNSSDVAIQRTYLAKIVTDGNGDVILVENFPVAKTKGVDAEYQGDVTVHGEIKNKSVYTAWALVDFSKNPPLVMENFNLPIVGDRGTGLFTLFPEGLETLSYGLVCSGSVGGTTALSGGEDTATKIKTLTELNIRFKRDDTNADIDPAEPIFVGIVGGKEII